MENEDDTDFSIAAKLRNTAHYKETFNKSSTKENKSFTTSDAVPIDSLTGSQDNSAASNILSERSVASPRQKGSDHGNSSLEYDFTHSKRGVCVILNNMQFDESTGHGPRRGSEKDAKNLEATFESLGFEVKVLENNTCYKMYKALQDEAKADHSDEDCFVCIILSHGDRNIIQSDGKTLVTDIVFGKDGVIAVKDLTEQVDEENCPSLKGKPKIFISQACRGTNLCEGVEYMETENERGDRVVVPTEGQLQKSPQVQSQQGFDEPDIPPNTLCQDAPIGTDYILICSCPPGYFSFRSPTKGSFFIKAICDQLKELHNDKDLMSIFTRVNHQVAYQYTSHMPSFPEYHKMKQMPWIASKLTNFIYMRK